jgi:DNA-directed RNA polymerase subunit alpha
MKKISLKDLIKPKKIEVVGSEDNPRYGKFVAEPLERGFGINIGNSLRRILLSSIQGSAITAINIDSVMHEFSTVTGVVEDVSEIVLNLKEVVLRLEDKEEAKIYINATGPCDVKASFFQGDSIVTVLNPDAHIATLGENGKLILEATVKSGRGYVPAERNKEEGYPAGTIFIDSIFCPIKKVNYVVSNARVGQRTDYDRLVIELWTNGSIDPRSAVAQAAHILVDQLGIFVGENLIVEEEQPKIEEPKSKLNENLFRRIEEIDLSVRSANCLENADIKYIGELVQKSEGEMLRTKNFGKKSLNEIKDILTKMGLSLGMVLEEFPSRKDLDQLKVVTDH